jgi:hypothetical protein
MNGGGIDEMARKKKDDGTLRDGRNLPIFIHSIVDDMTDLTPNAMRVYMHLARRANKCGEAFPSYQSIGDHCFGKVYKHADGRRKHAIAAVEELIAAKLIVKEMRQNEHGQISNCYLLLDPVTVEAQPGVTVASQPAVSVASQGGDSRVTGGVSVEAQPAVSVEAQRAVTVASLDPVTVASPKDTPIEDTPFKGTPIGNVGVPPTPPLDGERPRSDQSEHAWWEFLDALCWVCYGHQKIDALTEDQFGALKAEAKKIRDMGYDHNDLRDWFKKIWRNDWRWDKGRQRPRPDEVRSSIPILRASSGAYSEVPDDDRSAAFREFNPYRNAQP